MMARYEDIQKAFLNGEYSVTLNKVHTTDSGLNIHEVIAPKENKEAYDFVIRAISTYGYDVAPAEHAHWVEVGIYHFECSSCGAQEPYESPYCRQCGAKMDYGLWIEENE